MKTHEDTLIRPADVCRRLCLARNTVRALLVEGKLRGVIDPDTGRSRIWESSVDAYLARCETKLRETQATAQSSAQDGDADAQSAERDVTPPYGVD